MLNRLVALLAVISMFSAPLSAYAQSNGNGNGNAGTQSGNPNGGGNGNLPGGNGNGNDNNGQPGCQNGCEGNNGNGVGNTGPGNQGNTGGNGNAGGGGTTPPNPTPPPVVPTPPPVVPTPPPVVPTPPPVVPTPPPVVPTPPPVVPTPPPVVPTPPPVVPTPPPVVPTPPAVQPTPPPTVPTPPPTQPTPPVTQPTPPPTQPTPPVTQPTPPPTQPTPPPTTEPTPPPTQPTPPPEEPVTKPTPGQDPNEPQPQPTPAPQKAKERLEVKLRPALYLDFDMGTKVTNLTPHDSTTAQKRTGNPNSLIVDDFRNGFRVERYGSIEAGLGVGASFWFENASGLKEIMTGFAGLIPMKGSRSYTVQYARNSAEVARLPEIKKAPRHADELVRWNIGDSMMYQTEGGVMYFAGAGIGVLSLGPAGVKKSSWSVYVEKASATQAFVRISERKLKSKDVSVGSIGVGAGVSQTRSTDSSHSYLVDLKTTFGQRVFEDLVRGNVAAAQLASRQGKGAVQVDSQVVLEIGRMSHVFIGLPIILNQTFTKGKITSLTNANLMIDKSNVNVTYGIFVRDIRNRAFDTHASDTNVFYGASFDVTNQDGTRTNGVFGKYQVTLTDDSTSNRSLRHMVNELSRKSGLAQAQAIAVPRDVKMDHGLAQLDVTFSQANTMNMMRIAKASTKKQFVEKMSSLATRNFSGGGDILGLCTNSREADCEAKEIRQMRMALGSMHKSLMAMNASKSQVEFTRAYADFGSKVSRNGLMLQSAILLAGEGVEVVIKIEGERISRYEIALRSTGNGLRMEAAPARVVEMGGSLTEQLTRNRGALVAPGVKVKAPVNNR